MKKPRVLISRRQIAEKVEALAGEMRRDYRDRHPLLIGVLKGSFVFLADLVRALDIPLEVDFVRLSSYGAGTESSGRVRVERGLKTAVRGRHVLVIEDIVDTGLTSSFLLGYLRRRKPASLKLCTLFDKPSRRRVAVPVDYVGFGIGDCFVVGYGLDFDEAFRHLPDLCVLEEC